MAESARKFDDDELNPANRPNLRSIEGGRESEGATESRLTSVDTGKEYSSRNSSGAGGAAGEEVSAATPSATPADQDESSRLPGDDDEGWYKGEGKARVRGKFWTRRKVIGLGSAGVIIAGLVGMFGILQGPMQVIHFSQLLQKFHFANNQDFSDSRTGKLFIYLATLDDPSRRNLGVVGNRVANRYKGFMEEAGIRMEFDSATRNGKQVRRVQSFTVDTGKEAGQKVLESLRKQGIPPNDLVDLGNGQFRVSARGRGGTTLSRNVLRGSVDSLNLNKISGTIAYRLMIRRARVDMHPLRNRAYEEGQDRRDYNRRIQEEDAERDKSGVEPPDAGVEGSQEDLDGDGEPDSDTSGDADGAKGEIDAAKGVDGAGALKDLRTRYASLIKGGGLAGAGVGLVCAARGLGDQAEAIEHANIVLPLIRVGSRIVTTGSQVMTGQDVNLDELGAVSELFNSEEFGSWASARSIQAEMGNEPLGPDMPDEAKPSQVGEKPTLFRILDNSALGAACGVNDTIGGLPVIKQIGQGTDAAINKVLGAFGWSMERLLENLASLFAAEQVSSGASGSLLGNYANYGARLAANDQAISMGGRELSNTETAILDTMSRERLQNEQSKKSFAARLFDIYDADSLVASYSRSLPKTPSSALASISTLPTRFLSLFSPMARAQSSYDYGFNEYGFSADEQNDERLEDPFENAELIEPRLTLLNERYEGCFNTVISPTNGSITSGESVRYDQIASDDDCSDEGATFPDGTTELLRYRMYIADMVTTHSLACYEGEESSCQQLGFGGETSAAGAPTIVSGDTSHLTCEVGVDGGVVDGYQEGKLYKIRVCIVQGITVNAQIAKAVDSMLNEARSAGISMTGSGFRTMEGQREAYARYLNGGNEAARPGYSNHQMGLAIDINYSELETSLSNCQANPDRYPTYKWLVANAAKYGFSARVQSECWHWSVTGG